MSLCSGHSPSLQWAQPLAAVHCQGPILDDIQSPSVPDTTWDTSDYQPGQMLVQPKRKHCDSHIHRQGVTLSWAQLLLLWNLPALQRFLGVSGMAGKTCTSQLWDNHPCSFPTKHEPNTGESSLQLPTRATVSGNVSGPPRIEPSITSHHGTCKAACK